MQCKDKRLRPPQWRIVARAEKQFGPLSPKLKSQKGRIQRMPRATLSLEQTQVRERFRQFFSETSNAMVPNPPSIIESLSHINRRVRFPPGPASRVGRNLPFFETPGRSSLRPCETTLW